MKLNEVLVANLFTVTLRRRQEDILMCADKGYALTQIRQELVLTKDMLDAEIKLLCTIFDVSSLPEAVREAKACNLVPYCRMLKKERKHGRRK